MPLVQRVVQPVQVARGQIPDKCNDELEAVSVNILAGLVKQLGTLARHADDIFGALTEESAAIITRTKTLSTRMVQAEQQLSQLDHRRDGLLTLPHRPTDQIHRDWSCKPN